MVNDKLLQAILIPDGSFASSIVMKTENNNFYNSMYLFQQLFFCKYCSSVYVVDFTTFLADAPPDIPKLIFCLVYLYL